MKRFWFPVLCLALCLVMLCGCRSGEKIPDTLDALAMADAEFAGQVSNPDDLRDGCLLYVSNRAQMGCYFDPETHNLVSILHYSLMDGEYAAISHSTAPSAPMVIPADDREQALLRYAGAILGDAQIGTLSITSVQDQGLSHSFSITESYEGIETGTAMFFSTDANGRVSFCNITIGGVFRQNAWGNYEIAAGNDLISEEAAVETARMGLAGLKVASGTPAFISCRLRAREDTLLYIVTLSFRDSNGSQREYQGWVNAHTGALDGETLCR